MRRGDVYYADLRPVIGSEQGGIRPVLIIQNDVGNKHSPTVIVLPITSEIKKINMPTHCVIHKSNKNGLKVDSMVMAEQIRVIDKSRLKDYVGFLDDVNEQNKVINTYIANITGKKNYNSIWSKIVDMIFRLIKEGEHINENAA